MFYGVLNPVTEYLVNYTSSPPPPGLANLALMHVERGQVMDENELDDTPDSSEVKGVTL